ncbi:MAG: IS66 family insertion sequence hypothetical protein [Legionellales bacterium]|nr:IS66 family insertion sequence hypothetical protein [Legionellales bacterium]|tara:strand:- start:667 stop:1020 length:354 start_codon:yes stop_codon:yes gene_type:complete
MIDLKHDAKIYLYAKAIDCRKSIDGLSYLVINLLGKKPKSGDIFIFHNRSKDKLKALYWDNNGFVLYYKRMESRRFVISKLLQGEVSLSHEECQLLFLGYDFTIKRDANSLYFSQYF